jgi:O-antigen/teichoic acid export membrane protein
LGSSIIAQALPILMLPVLTRIYPAEAIGLLALLMSIATTLCVIATLRLDLAIVLPEQDREAVEIAGLVCGTTTAVVVLTLFVGTIPGLLPLPDPIPALAFTSLLCLMVVAMVVQQVSIGLATRRGSFSAIAAGTVVNQSANQLYALVSGCVSGVLSGLAEARVFGQAIGSALLMFNARHAWREIAFRRAFRTWRILAARYRSFLFFNTPYSLCGTVTRDAPLYALLLLQSTAMAGYYGLARTVVFAPALLSSSAFSQLFFRFALKNGEPAALGGTVRHWLRVGTMSSAPLFACVGVWGEEMFLLAFGSSWSISGEFASSLSIAAWWSLQTSWPERIFEIRNRQGTALAIQTVGDALTAAVFVGLLVYDAPLVQSVLALALCQTATQMVYAGAVARFTGMPFRSFANLALHGLATLGTSLLVLAALKQAMGDGHSSLAAGCLLSGAASLLLLLTFGGSAGKSRPSDSPE